MSMPESVPYRPRSVPLPTRSAARLAVGCAHLLALLPPSRIRTVLRQVRRGAQPATAAQTATALETVLAVSLTAGGRRGCLPRSLATVLLCRMRGQWPVWCVGVRKQPPFAAHAWVEAEAEPIGEDCPADYFQRFFAVD
ncbi:lasso peptide biosynthesis B2 protein [Streptomyces longwoodensis]|uniref:lasso peptide biosynthesis B2 protein n=1 Tax=Streptomyces longwoodensis TaxID=68231 RepID=UPI0036F7CF4D